MVKKIFFVFLIAQSLTPGRCFAFSDPTVSYLGIEQGLSNNGVTSIFQDHNGFIWIGTFSGLNRYDGYGFKVFRNNLDDTASLNSSYISAINEDADQHLWIGTSSGLNIYNPFSVNFYSAGFERSANHALRISSAVRAIERIGVGGGMLVGTEHNGLIVFEKNKYTGVQISFLTLRGREKDYDVASIAVDRHRQLAWVFVQRVGLCKYDMHTKSLQLCNETIKKADCLKFDSKWNLWLGNENGLFRYDITDNNFSNNLLSTPYRVKSLSEDSHHVLWISTDGGGVWLMPGGANQPVRLLSSTGQPIVNSNAVYTVLEDADGNKWIGTLRGGVTVIKSKAKPFKHIFYTNNNRENNIDDFILSFAEDKKNNVWIGTDGAGLRYWNRHNDVVTRYKHIGGNSTSLSSDFVTSMVCDFQGDLWAATWFGGINRLKSGSRIFEHFDCYNASTHTIENNNWIIYEDSHKRLWVTATYGGALYLFNRVLNRFEVFDKSLINIQCLTEDNKGRLWAGNYSSLIEIDMPGKKHRVYNLNQSVRSIHEDINQNLWVGTDGGGMLLFNPSNASFKRFSMSDGLPSNSILCILEDSKHNLWLSTYNGLCKFNIDDKVCRNFSGSDGLQSNQFSFNAALALTSGEFLFGGIKGFNVFYPDSVIETKEIPKIYLTGIKVNNEPIGKKSSYIKNAVSDWITKIEIPYDQAVVSLDYLALDYVGNDKIRYGYKLDGWDKDWINASEIRTANYSGLREGSYVFKIRIKNYKDKWMRETNLLNVVILPPWYRTLWAYVVYFCIASSMIYLAFMYYKRQQRLKYEVQLANYETKIANLEKEKERVLSEKKVSFFTHVSHEFRTPLTLIINPVKDLLQKSQNNDERRQLTIVHRNARRLLSLIDQLLIFRKAEAEVGDMRFAKQNFCDVCQEVFLCFIQQAKLNEQNYVFECENKDLELYIDKEKIEIALFNLISNAIKYTPNRGNIKLRVTETEAEAQLSVQDNGYGIAADAAGNLFQKFYQANSKYAPAKSGFGIGLYLVKHFVEAHKGTITFQSEEGHGTTFFVMLKKGTGHLEGTVTDSPVQKEPVILEELTEEPEEESLSTLEPENLDAVFTDRPAVLVVDDDKAIRQYLHQILKGKYQIIEADNGKDALKMASETFPDLIISDIRMNVMDGIELCKMLKSDEALNHIPIVLLTGSNNPHLELESIEVRADLYVTKPFDKDILLGKVENLFKNRNELQKYFFNEITLKKNTRKISTEYKDFLEKCIQIVEKHLDDDQFAVKTLCQEIGMSHNQLYKKVKMISGQTITGFVRFIRLRKAAELMIKSECNVNQAAFQVGISDIKYFRVQFNKLFGMNPSAYIKRYREPFNRSYQFSKTTPKDSRQD